MVGTATVTLPMVLAQAVASISLGLLTASGIAKLVDPAPTTGAMRAAGLPASRSITYTLGLVEVVTALTAFVVGSLAVIAAALLYLAFAVFTFGAVWKRIPVQSCGCFGRDDTPPNAVHVVYNTTASISLFTLAALSYTPVDWSLPIAQLALYLSFIVIGVVASYQVLARLPQVMAITETT